MTSNHCFPFDIVSAGRHAAETKKNTEEKSIAKGEESKQQAKEDDIPLEKTAIGQEILSGLPGLTPHQRDTAIESAITLLNSGSVDEACLGLCQIGNPTTMGVILENLVICVMETDSQTRVATGHLVDRLLSQTLISQDQLEREVLNKVVETGADMTLVIPNFWEALAEIFCPSFKNSNLPLGVLKDSSTLLPNKKMVGEFISAILNSLASSGKMKTHKAWKDSGLKWTDFVSNAGNIETFLETHNLRWLGTGQLDLPEAALGDLLTFNSDDESSEEETGKVSEEEV